MGVHCYDPNLLPSRGGPPLSGGTECHVAHGLAQASRQRAAGPRVGGGRCGLDPAEDRSLSHRERGPRTWGDDTGRDSVEDDQAKGVFAKRRGSSVPRLDRTAF